MFQRLTVTRLILWVVAVGPGAQVFAQRVYWTTDGGSTIERSVAGSFATEVLIWPFREFPRGIALDVDGGKVYWTSESGIIQRCDFDGTALETVVKDASISPHFLALDLGSQEVYWTDDHENKIYRAALNAQSPSVTELVSLPNGLRPEGIALDLLHARIYWASTDLTSSYDSRIQASELDGSNVHDVIFIGGGGVGGLALNVADGYFVWSHYGWDLIARADFGSTVFTPVFQSPQIEPVGIAISPPENAVYWVDPWFDQVRRTSLDDGGTRTLVQIEGGGSLNPYDIALDLFGGKMYWSDHTQSSIHRADLDGSRVETVIERITYQPLGIALNPAFGRVYWLDFSSRRMYSAALNGTNPQRILETAQYPMDVKLDVAAGKVYWVTFDGALYRANLDGTGMELLFGLDTFRVSFIALDLARGQIYWNDIRGMWIRRANLDGSRAEVVYSTPNVPLGLAVDQAAGRLYWIESSSYRPERSYLRSCTLDGKDPQTLVDVTADSPAWIALDLVRGNLYWGGNQNRSIRRANLDGTQVEIVATASNYFPARGLVDACERDGPVKLSELSLSNDCLTGPGVFAAGTCYCADLSGDARVDLLDFAIFQRAFSGE